MIHVQREQQLAIHIRHMGCQIPLVRTAPDRVRSVQQYENKRTGFFRRHRKDENNARPRIKIVPASAQGVERTPALVPYNTAYYSLSSPIDPGDC